MLAITFDKMNNIAYSALSIEHQISKFIKFVVINKFYTQSVALIRLLMIVEYCCCHQ